MEEDILLKLGERGDIAVRKTGYYTTHASRFVTESSYM